MGNRGTIHRLCLSEGSILNYQNEAPYLYKMNHLYGNNIDYINYKDLKRKTPSMLAVKKKLTNSCTS